MSHNQISEKKNNAELAGLQKKPYLKKKGTKSIKPERGACSRP